MIYPYNLGNSSQVSTMAPKKPSKDRKASVLASSNRAFKEQTDFLDKFTNSLKKSLNSEQLESLDKSMKSLENELGSEQLGPLNKIIESLEKELGSEQLGSLDQATKSLEKGFSPEQRGSLDKAMNSIKKVLSPEQLGSLDEAIISLKKRLSSTGDEIKKEFGIPEGESDSTTKESKSEKMLKLVGVRKVSRSLIQINQPNLTSGITPP